MTRVLADTVLADTGVAHPHDEMRQGVRREHGDDCGFVAGYLVGTRQGRDGLERLRSSWHSIKTSPEVRRLAAEAVTVAEMAVRRASSGSFGGLGGAVGGVTDILVRRAVAVREGSRAA